MNDFQIRDTRRSGRPITAITHRKIDAIKGLVEDDLHIRNYYIISILDIVYHMNYRDKYSKRLVKKSHKKKKASSQTVIPQMQDSVLNTNYVQDEKIKVRACPLYLSGYALLEFWLLSYLKRNLDTYPDATTSTTVITAERNSASIPEYQKTFRKWIERMKLCIEHLL